MIATSIDSIHDVLIAQSELDCGIAEFVGHALANADLHILPIPQITLHEIECSELRESLAGCSAFVVILTRSTLTSRDIPLKVGMALAWNKPIFVLYDGIDESEIPNYLRGYHVSSLTKLPQVVRDIEKIQQPFSDDNRETLADIYCSLGVTTDNLLVQPLMVRELAEKYNERTNSALGGEKLVQELIRLRKQGKLPKLNL